MIKKCFSTIQFPVHIDWSLLAIRIVFGLGMSLHGWGKIQNPLAWASAESGIPGFLQLLAAVSEFGGGIALIVGLLTRLGALGMAITMAVAIYMHAVVMGDPFVNMTGGRSYELATLYFVVACVLTAVGPGKFSFDRKIFGTK